jgi:hypothetical protein
MLKELAAELHFMVVDALDNRKFKRLPSLAKLSRLDKYSHQVWNREIYSVDTLFSFIGADRDLDVLEFLTKKDISDDIALQLVGRYLETFGIESLIRVSKGDVLRRVMGLLPEKPATAALLSTIPDIARRRRREDHLTPALVQ